MDAIIPVTLSLILITLYYLYRKRKFNVFTRLGIKGPPPHFIAGNLAEIVRKGPSKATEDWIKTYGKTFGYYIGTTPVLVMSDLDDLRQIQVKEFSTFMDRPDFIGGNDADSDSQQHLVALKGKKWKEIRTLLTPTFSGSKMKKMSDIMNNAIDELMRKIKATNGEAFDIYRLFQRFTMDIIGRTAFGIETNVQQNEKDPFLINAQGIFSIGLTSPFVFVQILFPELRWLVELVANFVSIGHGKTYMNNLLQCVGNVIKARRSDSSKRRNDLLQLMLDVAADTDDNSSVDKLTATGDQDNETTVSDSRTGKKRHMTDAEIRANAFLFLIAGYETTSTALAFTTHLLLEHPELQEKIKEEVESLIDHETLPNYDVAHKLQYLDQVLSESLRMYPPVPLFVTRASGDDCTVGNVRIPKGLQIQVPVHYLHHNPENWTDPEEFRPERFSPSNRSKFNNMAYQPFGAGPRNCVGMRFAQMEIKIALSRILRSYKLVPCEKTETGDIEVVFKTVNMTPKNGIWLRAIPR